MLGYLPVNSFNTDTDDFLAILGESISGGDLVSLVPGSSPLEIVRADASQNLPAHGFVLQAGSTNETRMVYRSGLNNQVTGLPTGSLFLSAVNPGKAVAEHPATGFVQYVGEGVAANQMSFQADPPVFLG